VHVEITKERMEWPTEDESREFKNTHTHTRRPSQRKREREINEIWKKRRAQRQVETRWTSVEKSLSPVSFFLFGSK
jgi:hypothetical protein